MTSSWKLFMVIEMLLLLVSSYQIFQNTPIFILLVIAAINIVYVIKKTQRTSFNQFQIIIGIVVVVLCLLTSPATWVLLALAVIFIGLKGVEVSGVDLFHNAPWKKKHMLMIKTVESDPKNGRRFKRPWIGNQRIGSSVYEWDDINFTIFSGDTIVDLGNTLLPRQDNVIMIRKGFGRTRILVPVGVGVVLEHSALLGNVIFEEEFFRLKNESLKVYSQDYDYNERRIRIITSTLVGDVEVVRL